jgi:putative Holliday junction resolvase
MRILAVDFGFRRIGLAVGDVEPRIHSPRSPLTATGALRKDADQIAAIARSEEADLVVIGLPVEPDGSEGRMARVCRQLAGHVQSCGLSVEMVDESLSSKEAGQMLLESGVKAAKRRKHIDGEAAMVIMERYLDEKAAT